MYQAFCRAEIQILGHEDGCRRLQKLAGDGTVWIASTGMIRRLDLKGILPEDTSFLSCFSSNPTLDDLLNCLSVLEGQRVRRLVCIGGGSAIDVGKALCALLGMADGVPKSYTSLREAICQKRYLSDCRSMELIAVPTTAGTGSEVTQWGTIWDERNGKKLSVDMPALVPDLALLVPEFTADMPARLTLSTGLDALAQAMEAFWAKAGNPLSQALAMEAVRYIREYLPMVLKDRGNKTYREGMCIGSLLSGLAFSKTRTTACHSISYPITMRYGVAHGFAVAVTLEKIAEINRKVVPEIEWLYGIFGGSDGFRNWLDSITVDVQPLRLSAMGVGEKDLVLLAEGAFTQGRMNNNPVALEQRDVEEILRSVF